jgi:VanZ family protein
VVRRSSLIRRPRRSTWILLCCLWVCFVFFSSTSLALQWSELAFHAIVGTSDGHFAHILHPVADKGFHVFMFTILALLLSRIFASPTLGTIGTILLIACVVGTCSEVLQALFPDRDPAIRDVMINFAGAVLGVLINTLLVRRLSDRSRA